MAEDDIPFPQGYRPATVAPADWSAEHRQRHVNYPVFKETDHYMVKVTSFDAGGFEAVVRLVNLQRLADLKMLPKGRRKPVGERDEADKVRSVRRSKTTVRHAVKMIGADTLMTLTTRQEKNTPDELAAMFKRFARLIRAYLGKTFHYVAVPEMHPSNPDHWHLHVAICGFLPVNQARAIWWSCCGGRGMGNIDLKRIKVSAHSDGTPKGPLVKSERIARYISKYMSKDLIFSHRPDKKRYWRSEFDMPEARRYWLEARPGNGDEALTAATHEFLHRFGLNWSAALSMFVFPDGTGFWLSHNPDASMFESTAPPPF